MKALKFSEIDFNFLRLEKNAWSSCESISIDYSIMEKTDCLVMTELSGYWTDVGSWESVFREKIKDEQGMVVEGDVAHKDCKNTLIIANSKSTQVVAYGLNNLIVVSTGDAVLIADMQKSNQIKDLVDMLKKRNNTQALWFKKEYKPWGFSENLLDGISFKVNNLEVKPGHQIGLQSHSLRSEFWIIVDGVAEVLLEKRLIVLKRNESIFIPEGSKHRLRNSSDTTLKVIEVQTGESISDVDTLRY